VVNAKPITVAETPLFQRQAGKLWSDEESQAFIDFIARNPEAGDIIPDTGGVRKVRWSREGMGKRGGVRVIYFYYHEGAPLWLLLVYGKADKSDMTQDDKRAASTLVLLLKQNHPPKRADK
jgi:RelE toxin of RelE / RelB toxin-antitoxin system